MSRRHLRTKFGNVTVDYRYRTSRSKLAEPLPAGSEVWVCPTCAGYVIASAKHMEQGRVHLTSGGDVCSNHTEFQKADQPDVVIAAYCIGGSEAIRALGDAAGLKMKQPVEAPPAVDNWPEIKPSQWGLRGR